MPARSSVWTSLFDFIKRKLQDLAIFLELVWIFFPGLLFILLSALVFAGLLQGKDVIALALESRYRGYFFLVGLIFWAGVTWYTGRLIAYNHDSLFQKASKALYHFPRIMGFLCFTVVILAFMELPSMNTCNWLSILVIAIDLLTYFIFHWIFERIKDKRGEKVLEHYRVIALIILLCLFVVAGYFNKAGVYLVCLPMIQLGFLFLVIIRRKITETVIFSGQAQGIAKVAPPDSLISCALQWILHDQESSRSPEKNKRILEGELQIFKWFNVATIVAIAIYLSAIFNLTFSRFLSPFPLALLAFGILLGFGNIVALFSTKLKINFHFIFIVFVVISGSLSEPHNVRLPMTTGELKQVYANRDDLHSYFENWINSRKSDISDSSRKEYPVFFALADGGASRSGYWTASVLAKIEEGTHGQFSRHLFCLSGASGGSVGNATFYASLYAKKYKAENGSHLEKCQSYLSNDFLSYTLARMLGPDFFKPLFPFDSVYDRAAALERSIELVPEDSLIGNIMAKPLSTFIYPNDRTESPMPVLCINTTRMQDGRPGVVSTIKIDTTIFGRRIDVLESLQVGENMNLSTAMILGARFPYVSPAGRIRNNYFVDGGYFDNSGAGVVHEMIIELQRMIHDSLQKNPVHYLGKIRFYVLHTTNSPLEESVVSKVHPLINDLAAPVKTLIGSYSNQTYVNNLRLFKYLLQINQGDTTYIPFNLYRKNEKELYPMNWVISDSTLVKMNKRLSGYSKIDQFISAVNQKDSDSIHHLFKDR